MFFKTYLPVFFICLAMAHPPKIPIEIELVTLITPLGFNAKDIKEVVKHPHVELYFAFLRGGYEIKIYSPFVGSSNDPVPHYLKNCHTQIRSPLQNPLATFRIVEEFYKKQEAERRNLT